MIVECRHTMTSGRKCHAPALRGKSFCFFHAKFHFRTSRTHKPGKITQPSVNLPALQNAVARALTTLSSPLANTRRAGLILYGINIAVRLSKLQAPGLDRTTEI